MTFCIEHESLLVIESGAVIRTIKYADITEVQLKHSPNRFHTHFYIMKIRSSLGAEFVIASASFKAVGDFEDRDTSYAVFVRALHETLAPWYLTIRFICGVKKELYILYCVIMFSSIPFAAFVLFWMLPANFSWIIFAKLAFMAYLFAASIDFHCCPIEIGVKK